MKRRALLKALPWLTLARAAGASSAQSYDVVSRKHVLSFPRDYGAHPGFRTEWWYVTGWLEREAAAACGFQITFFRSRTGHSDDNPSSFAPRQLLFAHAALALPERGRLLHEERAARAGAGGVRFSERDTALALGDWSFTRDAPTGRYVARLPGRDLDLTLDLAPTAPLIAQGDNGFSQKGPKHTQASHYYSEPQLAVNGSIVASAGGRRSRWNVTGRAWLDHEWSSTLLDERATGWDWIGLNFDDGRSLMAFRIRTTDGATLWSHAAMRDAQGRLIGSDRDAHWTPKRWWTSPRSQARYPTRFDVSIGSEVLSLRPLMDDQEIDARRSTGGFYWEGGVTVLSGERQVGRGYLELTGYATRLKL